MIFLVFLSSRHARSFAKKNQQSQLINLFLYNFFLFYANRIEITCKHQSNFQIKVVLKITFRQF